MPLPASAVQAAQQQPEAASEGGANWAGVAAAGLVVAGLSAAVYFAPEDALKSVPPPAPKVRRSRGGEWTQLGEMWAMQAVVHAPMVSCAATPSCMPG